MSSTIQHLVSSETKQITVHSVAPITFTQAGYHHNTIIPDYTDYPSYPDYPPGEECAKYPDYWKVLFAGTHFPLESGESVTVRCAGGGSVTVTCISGETYDTSPDCEAGELKGVFLSNTDKLSF